MVDLHRTVGPAHTTVSAIARKAGVGRMTVYKHFPTDADLIEACSTHWSQQNPLPDPEAWSRIADPSERVLLALNQLYSWYGNTQDMMGKVLRDASVVPALGELMAERWWAGIDRMCEILVHGRSLKDGCLARVLAALKVALDFSTWRSLTNQELEHRNATRLAAAFVETAAR